MYHSEPPGAGDAFLESHSTEMFQILHRTKINCLLSREGEVSGVNIKVVPRSVLVLVLVQEVNVDVVKYSLLDPHGSLCLTSVCQFVSHT